MSKRILLASLLAATALTSALTSASASADLQTWSYGYTGFFDDNAGVWNPDYTIGGSFAGEDRNHDRKISFDELSSLTINGQEYGPNCPSEFYFRCSTAAFNYDIAAGRLNFSAGFDGRDPEGYFYFGFHVMTGQSAFSYNYNIFGGSSTETHSFRPETQFSVSPPPVPEPETYALMASGLTALALLRRRKV
jgi:hypothetical protein